MTYIKAIGLQFSDSDFNNTVRHWLKSYVDSLKWKGYMDPYYEKTSSRTLSPVSIDEMFDMFRNTIGSFYLMYQHDDEYLSSEVSIIEYLEVCNVSFYINDDVINYMNNSKYYDPDSFFYWYEHTGVKSIHDFEEF